jgi:tRNA pseudouridine65 synthase
MFEILYRDEFCVVIDKPEGFHVHKPNIERARVPKNKIIMPQLRDQLGLWVYPVHRLDAATSGCLLWALSSESAAALSGRLSLGHFTKIYRAVVRGWMEDSFEIKIPLSAENDKSKKIEAHTRGRTLARLQMPSRVSTRYTHARYSLLELEALTGRFHQLRRHLSHVSHPIVGDVAHGDRRHNRYFREELKISGLCLRAHSLEFPRGPEFCERLKVEAPTPEKWRQIYELFSSPVC